MPLLLLLLLLLLQLRGPLFLRQTWLVITRPCCLQLLMCPAQ
jgi:hypothetical protein